VTEQQEPGVEEIDVLDLPEPDEPDDGVIDPADTYREGVDAE
jgi:hypothetical protein